MTDAQRLVGTLTSLLQTAANATAAAAQVSGILARMQREGREAPTAEEWAEVDRGVMEARASALDRIGEV